MKIHVTSSYKLSEVFHSVTLESFDVPSERGEDETRTMLAMAKRCIQAQLAEDEHNQPITEAPDGYASLPAPAGTNGNGNGFNGNGHITPKQLQFLYILVNKQDDSTGLLNNILKRHCISNLSELTKTQAGQLIQSLRD